jgi:hypothetical protein
MPTIALNPAAVVASSGFTNPNNALVQNGVFATSGTSGGHTLEVSLADAPADFGSLNSVTLRVRGRTSATASRAKFFHVELLSGGSVVASFDTPSLNTTNTTYTGTATPTLTGAELDAATLRITVVEGSGMADSVSTWADFLNVDIDYSEPSSSDALTATGVAAGAPTVGAPHTGQLEVLAANGVAAGAPVVGSPGLTHVRLLKVWTGTAWASGRLKIWNGSEWAPAPLRRWDGNSWAEVG